MTQRKYSVAEIDRMRWTIRSSYPAGPYMASERDADIENQLRTYMLNGTDPEELERGCGVRLSGRIEPAVTT